MSVAKRVLKHPLTQPLLASLLALVIRFVYATSRKTFDYHPDAMPYMRGEKNGIFAFWHGRLMLCPTICPPGRPLHVLISRHRDGLLISSIIRRFALHTVAGSSSRGGSEAVKHILRLIGEGNNIAITPDGPRGPFQQAAMGVVTIARLSGVAVLPVTFSATRHKRLKSWDRFMLAKPFGRIVFCVGKPIVIDQTDDEKSRKQVEQAMNALVEHADRITGA